MKLLSLSWSGCHGPGKGRAPGMTLLEMTVVILVLLSMVTLLFVSGRAWKNGSDRALCIVNLEMVQKAVRSFSNLYGYMPGESVPGLENKVIGSGLFVDSMPECPGTGSYSTLGDQIPEIGTPYMSCSLAAGGYGHAASNTEDW
jgi:competence protein ComGC